MKLITIALVSFLMGILAAVLLMPRNHVFAQDIDLDNGFMPKVPPFGAPSPVPRVMPLHGIDLGHNTYVGAGPLIVPLDGLESHDNVYAAERGVVFVYGGGAYRLAHNLIGGHVTLRLTGAAANTAELLESFGLLAKQDPETVVPAPPAQKERNKPITHNTRFATPLRGDLASQYDGTQK